MNHFALSFCQCQNEGFCSDFALGQISTAKWIMRAERDTGQWLSVSTVAEQQKIVCVFKFLGDDPEVMGGYSRSACLEREH